MSVIVQVHVLPQVPVDTVARTVAQQVIARPVLDPRNANPSVREWNRTRIARASPPQPTLPPGALLPVSRNGRIARRQAAIKLVAVGSCSP